MIASKKSNKIPFMLLNVFIVARFSLLMENCKIKNSFSLYTAATQQRIDWSTSEKIF